jgi:putative hydrolase of HD superfamily
MDNERLQRQIQFLLEIDALKSILRQSYHLDGLKKENAAEHCWHVAVMALVLSEYADEAVDPLAVLKMLLVHDLVEIDAGDTFCYDEVGRTDQAEREARAAKRIFALLPEDQAADLHDLWRTYEARQTPEARFAAALDRLMPLLHNYYTRGKSWQEHGVTLGQVLDRNRHIGDGSWTLWAFVRELIDDAVDKGYLAGA